MESIKEKTKLSKLSDDLQLNFISCQVTWLCYLSPNYKIQTSPHKIDFPFYTYSLISLYYSNELLTLWGVALFLHTFTEYSFLVWKVSHFNGHPGKKEKVSVEPVHESLIEKKKKAISFMGT